MSEPSTASSRAIPISVVAAPPAAEKQLGNDKIALNRAGFDASVPTLR
ncbi:MAG: lipoyl synthase, partial [Rhodanobacter sp.]